MAKFCSNCGMQLDDNANVCGNCGTPLEGNSGNLGYTNPEKQEKTKNIVTAVVAAVAVALVIFIGFNIFSGFIGYKGTIRKFIKSYQKCDAEAIFGLMSSVATADLSADEEDRQIDMLEDSLDSSLDELEDKLDGTPKFSYKITKVKNYTERQIENTIEDYVGEDEAEDYDIKAMKEVKIKLTAKYKDDKESETFELILAKEDGSWKIVTIN